MRKAVALGLVVSFIAISVIAHAQTFPQYNDKYVNDFAGIFDLGTVFQLRTLLSSLEQNTTAEVVVVTVQTTAPLDPSQYRFELFNTWHIGKAGKDNGLLILYAVSEKKISIETGYGLEGILPDSKIGSILDESYVPQRDANQTVKGIVAATYELAGVINDNADEVRAGTAGPRVDIISLIMDNFPFVIFLILVIVPSILSAHGRPTKCEKCGEPIKMVSSSSGYEIYECKNGHRVKRKKPRYGAFVFVGGGRGWGGGGGGFGGGRSGGGGVSR